MNLIINGENYNFNNKMTFTELIENLNIENKNIIIEANGEIINKNDFDTHYIEDEMVIEIIKFVGGG